MGNIKKDRTGERHLTKEGYWVKIVGCDGNCNFSIEFEDGVRLNGKTYQNIKNGEIKNPYHPSVCGVGYNGIGIHIANKRNKVYSVWGNLLKRCYNKKQQLKQPTYKGCTVATEWHNFQNFAEWYHNNYNLEPIKSWHLDKDILVKGNKIYSPETCCIVPREINVLFKVATIRNSLPRGVSINSRNVNKYDSQIKTHGKYRLLGSFNTPEEAFQAYKIAKELWIKEVAEEWRGKISEQVYQAMYKWVLEITD